MEGNSDFKLSEERGRGWRNGRKKYFSQTGFSFELQFCKRNHYLLMYEPDLNMHTNTNTNTNLNLNMNMAR
jgi:hypothetical protein